jgi:hypothetical protein
MSTTAEKKSSVSPDSQFSPAGTLQTQAKVTLTDKTSSEKASEKMREAIRTLDAQRAELVKNALDNVKPGRTFDASVVRQINKLETMRNRVVVAHFAWLLKHSPSEVHAIVHQIIEL